jgi:hypothetical protein
MSSLNDERKELEKKIKDLKIQVERCTDDEKVCICIYIYIYIYVCETPSGEVYK